jgi:hypothetical protein
VLGDGERGELSTALSCHAGRLASWTPYGPAGRTYALVEYSGASPQAALRERYPLARVDEPPLVVLEVAPDRPAAGSDLAACLAGAGGPVGIIAARQAGEAVVVELDDGRTPLSLVIDLIDAELAASPGRRITPLIALTDGTLSAFAGALLAEPALDPTRLIETYVEPLLADPPC